MKKASNAALVLLGICVLSICLTEPAFAASRANVLDTTVSKFQVAATNFGSRVKASHYTHLPALYPIVLDSDHTERADELGEAGV